MPSVPIHFLADRRKNGEKLSPRFWKTKPVRGEFFLTVPLGCFSRIVEASPTLQDRDAANQGILLRLHPLDLVGACFAVRLVDDGTQVVSTSLGHLQPIAGFP